MVGGRVTGPGVAGLTLGGGFSWWVPKYFLVRCEQGLTPSRKTNQYGLACDTVQAYNVVLPVSC